MDEKLLVLRHATEQGDYNTIEKILEENDSININHVFKDRGKPETLMDCAISSARLCIENSHSSTSQYVQTVIFLLRREAKQAAQLDVPGTDIFVMPLPAENPEDDMIFFEFSRKAQLEKLKELSDARARWGLFGNQSSSLEVNTAATVTIEPPQ